MLENGLKNYPRLLGEAFKLRKKWIPVGNFVIGDEEKKVILDVLNSGRISEGSKTSAFGQEFARYIGTKYAIPVSSGASALIAGLMALTYYADLNMSPGNKVITTPITYIATSSAIVRAGYVPEYVDVDKETFVITAENIKAYLENVDDLQSYSLILPVHLMGYACDMDRINKIAKKYGLQTFEDSAQAHGTVYKNRKTGSLSLLAAFSFYIAHNIQAGEMGAITTDNSEVARLVRKIKAQGRTCDCLVCVRSEGHCPKMKNKNEDEDFDPRFTHDLIGYNFKVMEFQAALGSVQLKKANWIIRRRQENVKYLNERLEKYSDIFQLPRFSTEVSYLAYPLVIKNPNILSRKKLRLELERRGVETRPLFGCIPTQQPAFAHLKEKYVGRLPNAEYLGLNGLYIGCHQYIEQQDLDYIAKAFEEIIRRP